MRSTGNTVLNSVVLCLGAYTLLGCGYVAALLLGLAAGPAIAAATLLPAAWIFYRQRSLRQQRAGAGPDPRLFLVLAAVTAPACLLIKEHGAYDAWLHWNSLAKYMSRPEYFRMLHMPWSLWHADYPPGLPAPIGFAWRISGTDSEAVPRLISFLMYLGIPLLLCNAAFAVTGRRYLWVLVLALFTVNVECLSQGLNQYADVPLALALLLSMMLWDVGADDRGRMVALGLMLGACLLLKNEGAVLVPAFLASRGRALLRSRGAFALIRGMLIPAAMLIAYKCYIPTPNDVTAGIGVGLTARLSDPARYLIIGKYLLRFGIGRFPLFIVFFAWVAWLRRSSRWTWSKDLVCLMLCAGGYVLVYLTTDIGLDWLVPTSMNRLMMQLLPAAVYVAVKGLQESKMPAMGPAA